MPKRTPTDQSPNTQWAQQRLDTLLMWFALHGRDWPWRRTRDRWIILVSEVCLQQTQVARAAPKIDDILKAFPTPSALASAPLHELLTLWHGLGFPRRARNLWLASQQITEQGWPDDLRTLPGVGAYTEAAVRCFADEHAVLPPDINTRRVVARLFPDGAPSPEQHPRLTTDAWQWGQAVMELGQTTCKARALCDQCPLVELCPSAGTQEVIASPKQQKFAGSLRQRRGKIMKRLVVDGFALIATDPEACQSLIADQLADAGHDSETGEEIIVATGQ